MDENMEELDNIITLNNEDGEEVKFEFLDLVDLDDEQYVVLLPINQNEDEGKLSQIAEEQAKEVIELLGSNEDSLTPEDFMNIMTSNTMMPENLEETL